MTTHAELAAELNIVSEYAQCSLEFDVGEGLLDRVAYDQRRKRL
jgi:hypothetical protein